MKFAKLALLTLSYLLITSTHLAFAQATSQSAFKIGYAQYAPYSFTDLNGPTGIEVDVLKYIFERLGIPATHQILPWKRVQANTQKGMLDAYVAVSTPERLTYTFPSEQPITTGKVVAFYHIDNQHKPRFKAVEELTDLHAFQIGGLNGNGWNKKNIPEQVLHKAVSMRTLTRMLLKKRVDFVPENLHIFQYYLTQLDDDEQIVYKDIRSSEIKLRLLISKRSQFAHLLPKIDDLLLEMRDSGILAEIHAKYR